MFFLGKGLCNCFFMRISRQAEIISNSRKPQKSSANSEKFLEQLLGIFFVYKIVRRDGKQNLRTGLTKRFLQELSSSMRNQILKLNLQCSLHSPTNKTNSAIPKLRTVSGSPNPAGGRTAKQIRHKKPPEKFGRRFKQAAPFNGRGRKFRPNCRRHR